MWPVQRPNAPAKCICHAFIVTAGSIRNALLAVGMFLLLLAFLLFCVLTQKTMGVESIRAWPVDPSEMAAYGEANVSAKERRRSGVGASAPRSSIIGTSGFQPANDSEEEEEEDAAPSPRQSNNRERPSKNGNAGAPSQRGRVIEKEEENELDDTPAPPPAKIRRRR